VAKVLEPAPADAEEDYGRRSSSMVYDVQISYIANAFLLSLRYVALIVASKRVSLVWRNVVRRYANGWLQMLAS
jgi:hypothetical protein